MTYAIKAKRFLVSKTKKVEGVPALHRALAGFRTKGYTVTDISRVVQ